MSLLGTERGQSSVKIKEDQTDENKEAVYSGLSFGRQAQQAEEWESREAKKCEIKSGPQVLPYHLACV